jgi:hypothetical protein
MQPNQPQFGQFSNILGQTPQGQQTIPDKDKQPSGTGFTNLQTILGANQGAGQNLQNAITGGINQSGQQAQTSLQNSQQQFGQGIGQAEQTQSNRQSMVQNALGAVDQTNAQGQNNLAPGAAQGFADLRNAQYNGPTGLNNAQQIQAQAQQANQYGQLTGSRGGRQQLLQDFVGQPGYTANEQRRDELYLGGSQPALRQAAQNVQPILGQTQNAIKSAQLQGQAQQAALQQLQGQASTGISSRQGNINSAIQSSMDQANATAAAQGKNVQDFQNLISQGNVPGAVSDALNSGLITQDQANVLGQLQGIQTAQVVYNGNQSAINPNYTPWNGQNIYNTSAFTTTNPTNSYLLNEAPNQIGQAIQFGQTDTSKEAIANQMQKGQLNALSQLAGGGDQLDLNYKPTTTQTALQGNVINSLANDLVNQYQTGQYSPGSIASYINGNNGNPNQSAINNNAVLKNLEVQYGSNAPTVLAGNAYTNGLSPVGSPGYGALQAAQNNYAQQIAALQQLASQYPKTSS